MTPDLPTASPPPLPLLPGDRRRRAWGFFAAALIAVAVLGWVLWRFEPDGQAFYPQCQFHRLTGLQCPGCGGTRAVHHHLHGEWKAAIRSNALLVFGILPAGLWIGSRAAMGHSVWVGYTGRWVVAIFVVLGVFFIVRNLPGPTREWLSPPETVVAAPSR